jgi:hypothetical protein
MLYEDFESQRVSHLAVAMHPLLAARRTHQHGLARGRGDGDGDGDGDGGERDKSHSTRVAVPVASTLHLLEELEETKGYFADSEARCAHERALALGLADQLRDAEEER